MKKRFAFMLVFVSVAFFSWSQGNVVTFCPGNTKTLAAGINGTLYFWQVRKLGQSFAPLNDGARPNSTVLGSSTSTLTLSQLKSLESGTQYRCIVVTDDGGVLGPVYMLQAQNVFNNMGMPIWENGANWSCGTPPDNSYAQNVIIPGGNNVLLKNVALLGGLTLFEDAKMTVAPGAVLVINPAFYGFNSGDYNLTVDDLQLLDSIAAPLEDVNLVPAGGGMPVSQMGVDDKATVAGLIEDIHKESVRLSAFKTNTKNIFGTNYEEPDQNGYAYSYG